MSGERRIWIFALAAAVLLSVFFVIFSPGLDRDAFARYAIMAEEFARGNFTEAYHPKYCVLLQTLAGCLVWLTGLSGFAACQIVVTFGWCLAAVPLWHVARRAFGERAAWLAAGLLLVVPEFFNYGAGGMRDGFRVLPYALMALGAVSSPFCLGVGVFLSVTLRADGILVGGAVAGAYAAWKVFARDYRALVWPVAFLVLALAADSLGVWLVTGRFVPTTYGASAVPPPPAVAVPSPPAAAAAAADAGARIVTSFDSETVRVLGKYERLQMMSGHFILLLVAALACVLCRAFRRRVTREEIVVVAIVALADVCILGVQFLRGLKSGGGFVTFWRYHYPAYALLFVPVAGAAAGVLSRFRFAGAACAAVLALALGLDARSFVRRYGRPDKSVLASQVAADRWAAALIRADWKGPSRAAPASDSENYACSRLPVVYCLPSPRAGYWSGGRPFDPVMARDGHEVMPDYWLCASNDERFVSSFCRNPPREKMGEFRTRRQSFVLYRTRRPPSGGK